MGILKDINDKVASHERDNDRGLDEHRICTYGRGLRKGYRVGNRASLEDQVANAANVEMNISSRESYAEIHPAADNPEQLVTYYDFLYQTNCEGSRGR